MKTLSLINFTTRLKNSKTSTLYIPTHTVYKPIVNILYKEGYIMSFGLFSNSTLKVVLRCNLSGTPLIKTLKTISTPAKQVYIDYKKICSLNLSGKVGFFTTSKGFLTSYDCKKYRVGGVFLFSI